MKNGFIEIANKTLLGRKISSIKYMSTEEAVDFGWYKRPMVIVLDDGTEIYPQMDEEGNDGGALALYNADKEGQSMFSVMPTLTLGESEVDYRMEIFTDKEPTLETLQSSVGGHIQVVTSKDGKADIVMDEDGKNKGKGINYLATEMWKGVDRNKWDDVIVGDVAVCMKKARLT
tara:strand:- start:1678 stop:2199 length:522 start_codon:yes stop_codon:yes gene_type:complete